LIVYDKYKDISSNREFNSILFYQQLYLSDKLIILGEGE